MNNVRIAGCSLSDPEEDIYVKLKAKEKLEEEDEIPEDEMLPGEWEEVDVEVGLFYCTATARWQSIRNENF